MPARRAEVIEEVLNVRGFQAGRDPVPFQDFLILEHQRDRDHDLEPTATHLFEHPERRPAA